MSIFICPSCESALDGHTEKEAVECFNRVEQKSESLEKELRRPSPIWHHTYLEGRSLPK